MDCRSCNADSNSIDSEVGSNAVEPEPQYSNTNASLTIDESESIIVSRKQMQELIAEYEVLYGSIEGARNYIQQQDNALGAEALCMGLATQSTRILKQLAELMNIVIVCVLLIAVSLYR